MFGFTYTLWSHHYNQAIRMPLVSQLPLFFWQYEHFRSTLLSYSISELQVYTVLSIVNHSHYAVHQLGLRHWLSDKFNDFMFYSLWSLCSIFLLAIFSFFKCFTWFLCHVILLVTYDNSHLVVLLPSIYLPVFWQDIFMGTPPNNLRPCDILPLTAQDAGTERPSPGSQAAITQLQ